MPAWVSSPIHREMVAGLVAARHARGLTQRDLASLLRKTPSFVGKVEAIERNLSLLEFVAWTVALDVRADEIIPKVAAVPEI